MNQDQNPQTHSPSKPVQLSRWRCSFTRSGGSADIDASWPLWVPGAWRDPFSGPAGGRAGPLGTAAMRACGWRTGSFGPGTPEPGVGVGRGQLL